MDREAGLTVGAIARLSGITVRTLHHYGAIGLAVPGERSPAGYRRYGPADVERLQERLFFRELGFPLAQKREIVAAPAYSRAAALNRHRALLQRKAARLRGLLDTVDQAIEAQRCGTRMTDPEMLEVLDGFDPSRHRQEAEQRWGDTPAYRESARRTAGYGKADRHRASISKWFYACTPEIHRGLGEMHAADPRFTTSIDRAGAALAEYPARAIAAHAPR